MSACSSVLEELAAIEPRGVIAEMCSIKTHMLPVLEKLSAAGLRIVSFHPLFGPDVRMLSGRGVVFCSDAEPGDLALVKGLFEETSARLIELDIGPGTAISLSLVPLVFVAWADGKMSRNEREAILRAAETRGVAPGAPARELLETWLSKRPEPSLLEAWKGYVRALWPHFNDPQRAEMRASLLGNAREIAEAAGGFLGLTSRISEEERAVLRELEEAVS